MSEAELHEVSGMMAVVRLDVEPAIEHFRSAISLFQSAGATHPAARVSSRLGDAEWTHGKGADALETMEASYEVLADEEPDADLAELAAQLARFSYFAGDTDRALERVERPRDRRVPRPARRALGGLEHEGAGLPDARSVERSRGSPRTRASIALEHDKPSAALRALNNLVDLELRRSVRGGGPPGGRGLSLARRVGNRFWESSLLGHVYSKFASGKWDELLESLDEIPEDEFVRARAGFAQGYVAFGTAVRVHRGELDEAACRLTPFSELEESADVQEEVEFACGAATLRLAEGDAKEALRFARVAIAGRSAMSVGHMSVKEAVVVGLEAASSLDDRDTLAELPR